MTEVPAPYSGSAAPSAVGSVAETRRRGPGIWSLILGVLAVLGDVIVVVVIVEAARTVSVDINSGLANLFAAAVVAVIVMIAGFLVSLTGLILGILAVARGRGRVLGVVGMMLSIMVVLSYVIGIVLVATAGSGLVSFATWV